MPTFCGVSEKRIMKSQFDHITQSICIVPIWTHRQGSLIKMKSDSILSALYERKSLYASADRAD